MARKPPLPSYIDDAALKSLSEMFDTALNEVLPEILAHFPENVEEAFYDIIPQNEDALKEDIVRAAIAVVSADQRDKDFEVGKLKNAIRSYLTARGVPDEMPPEINEHIQSVADDVIGDVQRRKRKHETARTAGYLKKN